MSTIYHLCPVARWNAWPAETPYLPEPYEQDGFIHCTAGDELLLQVANRFYRTVPGDFVALVIETNLLTSRLVWEAPSPGDTLAPQFPHIYGPINPGAIVDVRSMQRDGTGTFIAIR
jgi:uncharacterized protein (DUF952 family)